MKNIKLLLYAFSFLLIFSSCDDDDDDTPPPSLVGAWELTDYNANIKVVTTYTDGTPTKTEDNVQTFVSSDNLHIHTFTDNEYTIEGDVLVNNIATTEIDGEITVSDETQLIGLSIPGGIILGTWTLTGDQLELTPEGEEVDVEAKIISEFTENSHKLTTNFTATIADTDTFTVVITFQSIETFERI